MTTHCMDHLLVIFNMLQLLDQSWVMLWIKCFNLWVLIWILIGWKLSMSLIFFHQDSISFWLGLRPWWLTLYLKYVIYFGPNLISWWLRKQLSFAISFIQVEFRSLASVAVEITWIHTLLIYLVVYFLVQPYIMTIRVKW